MLDPDSSYANADTNIVRLYRLYKEDTQRRLRPGETLAQLPVYIEGIGTRAGQPDSALSMGMGLGASGVLGCVQAFPAAFAKQYVLFERNNPEIVVEAIEFDLFGFSRGAVAARHFANEVLKASGGIAAMGLAQCFSWQRAKVKLNFIGLFDTVTAMADSRRGDFTPTDIASPGVNFYLLAGCAAKVMHLVARDEYRRNFALTRVAPQHEEIALPGAHADLRGGYAPEMTERLLLTRPRASRERYGTDSHAAWSYRQVQVELAQFQREAWFDPGSATLKIDTWRNNLPRIRSELPETEVISAVRLERQVRGELSLVYLRVMHRLAIDHGVALSPIPMTAAWTIPDELQGIAAKLQANAQGAPLPIDQAEARLLFSRDVHLSAHWNALLGKDFSDISIFFVNAPTATGQTQRLSQPSPGRLPRMSRWLLCLILTLGLAGCQSNAASNPKLPYDAWYLGFLAPNYMQVWLELANVSDIDGRFFPNAMGGVVAMGEPVDLSDTAVGWPERIGSGKGIYLKGLDLPYMIAVRWQSLVEPMTYQAVFAIPAWERKKMLELLPAECPVSARTSDYRKDLTVGLAPGGVVKVWIMGPCLDPIEVLTLQAEVEPKGPDQGRMKGQYALPLTEVTKAYIARYGVPYGSWWAPIPYTSVAP